MTNILPLLQSHSQNLISLNSETEQEVQNLTPGLDCISVLCKPLWVSHSLLSQGKVQAACVTLRFSSFRWSSQLEIISPCFFFFLLLFVCLFLFCFAWGFVLFWGFLVGFWGFVFCFFFPRDQQHSSLSFLRTVENRNERNKLPAAFQPRSAAGSRCCAATKLRPCPQPERQLRQRHRNLQGLKGQTAAGGSRRAAEKTILCCSCEPAKAF